MKIDMLGAGHLETRIIKGLLNSGKYQKSDFKIVVASDATVAGGTKQLQQLKFLINIKLKQLLIKLLEQ